MKLMSEGCRAGMVLTFLISVAVTPIVAQDGGHGVIPDSSATSIQSLDGNLLDELPADRVDALLPLRPGITDAGFGRPSLRGGRAGDAALYVDGVPVLPGFRGAALFRSGTFDALDAGITLGTNAIEAVDVITGPLPAGIGNGRDGAILYRTRQSSGKLNGSLAYEGDEALAGGSSVGFNRLQGIFGGDISSRFSIMAAGVLEGQRGMNTGFDADRAPVFVPVSVDTTVAVPNPADPGGPATLVPVYDYAVYRGDCDQFSGSANAEIAANFAQSCSGSRVPGSDVSNYQFLGKARYSLGTEASVSLLALASQGQNRNFDYGNLGNTQALTGNRGTSAVYTLSLRQPLRRSSDRPIVLQLHFSHQRDRELSGPLDPAAAADLVAPFAGFALSPLDLRFDQKNFPVSDELVRNYQLNLAGRSPFDLQNPSQYSLIDQFRNNAYGLYNFGGGVPLRFFDGGGPAGRLTLYRENRWVGAGTLDWTLSGSQRVRIGGEFTRFTVGNYSHVLTEQIESDVWLETPSRGAVFAEDQIEFGPATLTAGLRFDYFRSGARRAPFPVIITHPSLDPANPDAFLEDNSFFPEDEGHTSLSPRFRLAIPVSSRTVVRAGYANQAQMPDFRLLFSGINSDINLVGFGMNFSADLDFEKTRTYELGIRHHFDQRTSLDAAGYLKQNRDEIVLRLVSAFNPTVGVNSSFRRFQNEAAGRARGLDIRLDRRFSDLFNVSVAYSYQKATRPIAIAIGTEDDRPTPESHPHAVAGILALDFPADWRRGSAAGTILARAGLFATFRAASGTPYTQCASRGVLSGEDCPSFSPDGPLGQRLPSYRQLDFRLTKGVGFGRQTLTAYLDVRNLLNSRNILAVFASNGETSSPAEAANHRFAMLSEYSEEALASGVRLPDGSIDLTFGGITDPRAGCGSWQDQSGNPAAPNCVYLIRAEERFGNGDHVFAVAEQAEAAGALYQALRGIQNFTGAPRRVRLGLEVQF